MSILSQLLGKKITFSQAAAEVGNDVQKVFANVDPAGGGEVLADLKQAASNAIDLADTKLGALLAPAASTVEGALDGVIAAYAPGLVGTEPILHDGIDRAATFLKSVIDAYALKAKTGVANATSPQSVSPVPPKPV